MRLDRKQPCLNGCEFLPAYAQRPRHSNRPVVSLLTTSLRPVDVAGYLTTEKITQLMAAYFGQVAPAS